MDGTKGLPDVLVYPDRLHRVRPDAVPTIFTDKDGYFRLEVKDTDTVLVVEKSGWQRDLVPLVELKDPILLQKAPQFRHEHVLLVRLDFPDQPLARSDDELRRILFSRQPCAASAANYLYEVSKGSLQLEEGAIIHVRDPVHPAPRTDERRGDLVRWVLSRLKDQDLRDFDQVDNRTGALRSDGKPDHLWIFTPGPPGSVTGDPAHLGAVNVLEPLPWNMRIQWSVLFATEETPLGNFVHEAFHAMGEHRVDDLYMDCKHPLTAGIWDLMDVGQYRGWDALVAKEGPWQDVVGYSPSQPMGWIRAELWYHGCFKATVKTETLRGKTWQGWIDPLERAPNVFPQRLMVRDPRKKGCFWELSLRRPWGFDRGRVGNRFGPGFEGLIVAHIDPKRLSVDGASKGPVHVIDAHPDTPEPPEPRFRCERWQLDDAAFNVGTGENPKGSDGPLSWEVLAVEAAGSMKVKVRLQTP